MASDPLVWEQHPTKERYQRDAFTTYFQGGLDSGGALLIQDEAGVTIGSSRFYDLDEAASQVAIGYTFVARRCWGRGYNQSAKGLMLGHAFQAVNRVVFHVGRDNRRSRIAMERLGGVLIGEVELAYQGEPRKNPNVVYAIDRATWPSRDVVASTA